MKYVFLLLLLSGCGATHQAVFDPWRGFSKELAAELKKGELPFEPSRVFKAATDALEGEPFVDWELKNLDLKSGLIEAVAGGGTVLKLAIVDAAPSSPSAARLTLSLAPSHLKGVKKVWMNRNDSLYVTAYEIPFSKRDPWKDLYARFEYGQDYLLSAIYRRLFDQSAVPFALEPIP